MKEYQNKEHLKTKYDELGSLKKTAEYYGVSKKLILNYMNKFDLPIKDHSLKLDEENIVKEFNEGANIKDIAKNNGVSIPTIRKIFTKLGINTDRFHKGYSKKANGYILIRKPDHPNCDSKGYVLLHRLIVEEHIKRYLTKGEVIHHIDFNKDNNDISNLQILNASEHAYIHSRKERKVIDIDKAIEMIDSGMKRYEVAKHFGICPDTLRAKINKHNNKI